jgi:tripartite-type tricarboxylate transporter receptor subunit TctC
MQFSHILTRAALCAALAFTGSAFAQEARYPTKPVRIIVPFAPGGGTDITTRAIAQKLTERLGAPFVVDNRAGANGVIGVDLAAKSAPDGYTLVVITSSHAINVSIYKKLPYDLLRDLAPVTEFSSQPYSLIVNPSLPAKSVKELIALAKAKPGTLTYGSSGQGGLSHLAGALFESLAGIKLIHVPYKGGAPAMTDVIGGQIDMMFATLQQAGGQIKSGKLRVLAVTTTKRNAAAPDIPTMIEAGVPGYEVAQWFGLLAPAKTPQAIITRLHSEIVRILQEPEVKSRLAADGADAVGNTPEQFGQHIRAEVGKWSKVVKQIGLQPE